MRRTGVVTHPLYLRHDAGPWHPESPARLRAIYELLRESGLQQRLVAVEPRPAAAAEIQRVHSGDYFRRVAASEGRSLALDPDTHTSPDSYQAALLAAGGALALTEAVVAGELDNGFALVRPPGHHAERAQARGFCLFNNIAICASHAIAALGLSRVLILDPDLHHGNGTMHAFWDRADVLYISCHQYPFYPGTGALEDAGQGAGQGYTISVPLRTGMGDQEYGAILRDVFAPVAAAFEPELILVSMGYDMLATDPIGSMRLSPEGSAGLVGQMLDMAAGAAGGRLVLLLEGGYDVRGEAVAVGKCLQVLLGELDPPRPPAGAGKAAAVIEQVQRLHGQRWPFAG